jgi:hypothetical protein
LLANLRYSVHNLGELAVIEADLGELEGGQAIKERCHEGLACQRGVLKHDRAELQGSQAREKSQERGKVSGVHDILPVGAAPDVQFEKRVIPWQAIEEPGGMFGLPVELRVVDLEDLQGERLQGRVLRKRREEVQVHRLYLLQAQGDQAGIAAKIIAQLSHLLVFHWVMNIELP